MVWVAYQMLALLSSLAAGTAQSAERTNDGAALVSVRLASNLETALATERPAEGRALAAEVARLWRRPSHVGDQLTALFVAHDGAGPVLQAVRYVGQKQVLEAYRFIGEDGVPRYYDPQGRRIEPAMRNPPVPSYEQITERVQRGRGLRRHAGDDLKAPLGSDVVLPFAGRVMRTNWHRRHNGLCAEVLLDAGYTARFLHLSELSPQVVRGAELAAGAPIGKVGSTGHSTGAHLHYELLRHGRPVEPLSVHGRFAAALAPSSLPAFFLVRDAYRRQLMGPQATPAQAASATTKGAAEGPR